MVGNAPLLSIFGEPFLLFVFGLLLAFWFLCMYALNGLTLGPHRDRCDE